MTQWEYKAVNTKDHRPLDADEILGLFGRQGWEAFQIEFRKGKDAFSNYMLIYFKRQVIRDE